MKHNGKILVVLIFYLLAFTVSSYAVSVMENKQYSSLNSIGEVSGETVILHATAVGTLTPTPVPTATATPSPTPTNTPTPAPTNKPTPSPTPTPVVIDITISAVGDVTLGINQKQSYDRSFHEYYDTYGADYFLQNVKEYFEEDDFTIVNLEGTLTNSDNIRPAKEWNHKGRPEYTEILTNASVEAVSLGNNHIMDYQWDGVEDTIKYVSESGMEYALPSRCGQNLYCLLHQPRSEPEYGENFSRRCS